eukprot:superscaffoldBa00004442_g18885
MRARGGGTGHHHFCRCTGAASDATAVPLDPKLLDPTPAMAPPITAASPPPVASADWVACYSTVRTKHRRMLQRPSSDTWEVFLGLSLLTPAHLRRPSNLNQCPHHR